MYKDLEKRRKLIRQYIRKNSNATYKDLRRMGIKVYNAYKKGMTEAFKDAGVKFPREFRKKTKEEKRKIIIDYIRKNPRVGGHIIQKHTKINLSSVFKNIKEAYDVADISYPRSFDDRTREEKIKQIINLIKKNPCLTVTEIMRETNTSFYKFFKNLEELYEMANIKRISGGEKIRMKKRKMIVDFIKSNPLVTQREINKFCRTHVQYLFEKGIFEAYKKAGVKFPYERLKLYGVGLKDIRERAKSFESEIAIKLSGYGCVNRLVRTKRGCADVIFERKGRKAIIEIKDYQAKDISISQVKQLNKYLEDLNCNLGILVCRNKPKRDKFLMGKNKIFILDDSELSKIPYIMGI